LISGTNGFHIYFLVNHPEKIAELFKGSSALLHKKLWLLGHGYIKNSIPKDRKMTAIRQMERTIYDNTIFSPERIIFEAPPILKGGLYKKNTEAILINGTVEFFNLFQFENLANREEIEYLQLVKEAKALNDQSPYMVESKKIFQEQIRENIKNKKYKNNKEYQMLSDDEIVEQE